MLRGTVVEVVTVNMTSFIEHSARLHSKSPATRISIEVTTRADVEGIILSWENATRLVGTVILEQNDELIIRRTRCMTLATIAPFGDDAAVAPPVAVALDQLGRTPTGNHGRLSALTPRLEAGST